MCLTNVFFFVKGLVAQPPVVSPIEEPQEVEEPIEEPLPDNGGYGDVAEPEIDQEISQESRKTSIVLVKCCINFLILQPQMNLKLTPTC